MVDSRKQRYEILKKMISAAWQGRKPRVSRLNREYETLTSSVYSDPPSDLDLAMDNCRQSCVMHFAFLGMKGQLLLDAIERFSRIPTHY